jgi:catechol-2,3-dioxygenase
MIPVTGLNHIVLYVRNLEVSVEFYKSIFGLVEVSRTKNNKMSFLRVVGSPNHHDIALIALGEKAPSPPRGSVGLYHFAWEVKTIEELAYSIDFLKEKGCYLNAHNHGAMKSVYAEDPDGNEFEISWIVPSEMRGDYDSDLITVPMNVTEDIKIYSTSK